MFSIEYRFNLGDAAAFTMDHNCNKFEKEKTPRNISTVDCVQYMRCTLTCSVMRPVIQISQFCIPNAPLPWGLPYWCRVVGR